MFSAAAQSTGGAGECEDDRSDGGSRGAGAAANASTGTAERRNEREGDGKCTKGDEGGGEEEEGGNLAAAAVYVSPFATTKAAVAASVLHRAEDLPASSSSDEGDCYCNSEERGGKQGKVKTYSGV